MITKRKTNMLWFIWVILWPLGLWLSYHYYFINIEGRYIDITLFAGFMCIVALFPLRIKNNPIFFVNGISIAVFLTFGLFAEMVLTQLAVTIVLLKLRVGKNELYRYPLNLVMFTAISIAAAAIYWLLGGNHNTINYQNMQDIIAILGYAISIFIVNHFIIKLFQRYFFHRKNRFFDMGLVWELASSLLIIPVGFGLIVLYSEIGRTAIFYMGIPFVSISAILMLLYSYQQLNRYLEKTGEIGHQLTKRLEVEEVYDVFIHELGNLIPMDYAYIYSVKDNSYLLIERLFDVKMNKNIDPGYDLVEINEAFSGKVWAKRKPIFYNRSKEWKTIKSSKIPANTESVLSLPVEYDSNVIGVVTIVSNQRKAFEKYHYRILTILTNYLGVAIENAMNYEETKSKSERDSLTQLYNYRYLENELENYLNNPHDMKQKEKCSLLIMDIDHFKKINDVYGHESGNEIIRQIANRLVVLFGDSAIIARYGGEEFVVFLPGTELAQATKLAENLRNNIATIPFPLEKHIFDHRNITEVSITVSIGVAEYPTHCEHPCELIRHADRAMYIGAKRKGRNKVALYEELQIIG